MKRFKQNARIWGMIPETIVVAIVNTNRTRDLTPTKAKSLPNHFSGNKAMLNDGGGLENFTSFLTLELRSVINNTYRTNSVNTFLYHIDAFTNYLAIDPSIWWGDEMIVKAADSILNKKRLKISSFFSPPHFIKKEWNTPKN